MPSPTASASSEALTPHDAAVKSRRKPHCKSRNGCQRCKDRRVKCDEIKPVCSRCQRLHATCLYRNVNTSSGGASSIPTPAYILGLGVGTDLSKAVPPSGDSFSLGDLALMHHWSVSASISLSTAPWICRLWQTVVPGIAFHHDYLMHSILALAALHVAHCNPSLNRSEPLLVDAARHYTKAISSFREAIVSLDKTNCDAVFTTAIIHIFYVFAISSRESHNNFDALDAEWINMVRGCGAVLMPTYDELSRGPLSGLLDIGDWTAISPDDNPSKDDARLTALSDVWDAEKDPNDKIYAKTLMCLRLALKWMDDASLSDSKVYWAGPFIWLHIIPEEYLQLVWQRQPPALVLFACFGALVHRLDGFWWAEGWGKRIVGTVDGCVGPYWRPRIQWPLDVVA